MRRWPCFLEWVCQQMCERSTLRSWRRYFQQWLPMSAITRCFGWIWLAGNGGKMLVSECKDIMMAWHNRSLLMVLWWYERHNDGIWSYEYGTTRNPNQQMPSETHLKNTYVGEFFGPKIERAHRGIHRRSSWLCDNGSWYGNTNTSELAASKSFSRCVWTDLFSSFEARGPLIGFWFLFMF